ncbi:2-hydroxyacid dehydrogenase [candidate division GN15 bacterium]|nr:2-hydroxyacid dehydrogenase [candidate division GN15 bacterium]
MKVAVFSTKSYDRQFLALANESAGHTLEFFPNRLEPRTSRLAEGFDAVCAFVNDDLSEEVINKIAGHGIRLIALRCAGFNNVDLEAAEKRGLTILRVPAYSPYAVAEHTLALILALNRRVHRAYNRVREGNFSLENLLGFDLRGRTIGVIGTGTIGAAVVHILRGFDCRLLAYDVVENEECKKMGVEYVEMSQLFAESHIITIHCPLTPDTHHLIDDQALDQMQDGVMLINTSRGAIIDTQAVIRGLKTRRLGYLGLDVYEEEGDLFFKDLSETVIQDDTFARLLTFPNVLITGHQAFFTRDALTSIAETTINNISDFEKDQVKEGNLVRSQKHVRG